MMGHLTSSLIRFGLHTSYLCRLPSPTRLPKDFLKAGSAPPYSGSKHEKKVYISKPPIAGKPLYSEGSGSCVLFLFVASMRLNLQQPFDLIDMPSSIARHNRKSQPFFLHLLGCLEGLSSELRKFNNTWLSVLFLVSADELRTKAVMECMIQSGWEEVPQFIFF